MSDDRGALNENQARHLVTTCQYVNRLFADIEHAIVEAGSESPFARYTNDLSPAQLRVLHDYFSRLRTMLTRILAIEGLAPVSQRRPLRHTALTYLLYADSAIEELTPHHMRGYGALDAETATALEGTVEEFRAVTAQLSRALAGQESGTLRDRVAHLEPSGNLDALAMLEELIAKYGLVEFRGALTVIVETLERRGIEVAIFGRVSTGKSSLLNRLLAHDVLPVGVTPITAVPTRIRFGTEPRLRVWFADAQPKELDAARLPEYASERENPANSKRVTRLVVELPAPLLESGLTLVDTPGVGALSTTGGAETLAYLPHCDVATVLIDAGSTVTADDIRIVQALLDAGIRVSVLVSKADLLNESDRAAAVRYARELFERECRAEIGVAPVSIKPEFEGLFTHWMETELLPVVADQERQRLTVAARKMEILRAQLRSVLRQWFRRGTESPQPALRGVDAEFRSASAAIALAARQIDDVAQSLRGRGDDVVRRAAESVVAGQPERAAFDGAFQRVASDGAHGIRVVLQELLRELGRASSDIAASARTTATSLVADFDVDSGIREVPVPALPADLHLPGLGAERLLGRSAARAVLSRKLAHAAGSVLHDALDSYALVLRRWALDRLEQIRREWASAADGLRAAVDRGLGHTERPAISREDVERDLQRLG